MTALPTAGRALHTFSIRSVAHRSSWSAATCLVAASTSARAVSRSAAVTRSCACASCSSARIASCICTHECQLPTFAGCTCSLARSLCLQVHCELEATAVPHTPRQRLSRGTLFTATWEGQGESEAAWTHSGGSGSSPRGITRRCLDLGETLSHDPTWYIVVQHEQETHPAMLQRGDVVLQVTCVAAQNRQLLARPILAQPLRVLQQVARLPGLRLLQHRRRQRVQRCALLGVLCAGQQPWAGRSSAVGPGQRNPAAIAPRALTCWVDRAGRLWGRVSLAPCCWHRNAPMPKRTGPMPNKPTQETGRPCGELPGKPTRTFLCTVVPPGPRPLQVHCWPMGFGTTHLQSPPGRLHNR